VNIKHILAFSVKRFNGHVQLVSLRRLLLSCFQGGHYAAQTDPAEDAAAYLLIYISLQRTSFFVEVSVAASIVLNGLASSITNNPY
jgi:hypothetical protein